MGKNLEQVLIVFTRYPLPGRAKTRLIPALGPEGAAELQRRMTGHALLTGRAAASRVRMRLQVRYAEGSRVRMRRWLGPGVDYLPQSGGDLGARMSHAFGEAFLAGAQRVVVIGTDCPGLTPELLADALAGLAEHDAVLGPAVDGGYYLIGLRRAVPELFLDMPWGGPSVLDRTQAAMAECGLSVLCLAPLGDVDRPEDLSLWSRFGPPHLVEPAGAQISVVIPCLNEADGIGPAIASAVSEAVEVVVVDGGSRDDTVARAKAAGARVAHARTGRARQMNAGALTASGSILVFLHADSRLPDDYGRAIRAELGSRGTVAGGFTLSIDGKQPGLRLVEVLANWRSRRLALPYGDQALFVRADVFRELGGFADVCIMEDFDLVSRLRGVGRVAVAAQAVRTSARRWSELGVVRTTLINQVIVLGHVLGVRSDLLARLYHGGRAARVAARGYAGE